MLTGSCCGVEEFGVLFSNQIIRCLWNNSSAFSSVVVFFFLATATSRGLGLPSRHVNNRLWLDDFDKELSAQMLNHHSWWQRSMFSCWMLFINFFDAKQTLPCRSWPDPRCPGCASPLELSLRWLLAEGRLWTCHHQKQGHPLPMNQPPKWQSTLMSPWFHRPSGSVALPS